MSLTANATTSVPFFQKGVDFKSKAHAITGFFQRRAHSGRPKVVEHAATGGLTAKADGATTALNLKAMHKAANPPSKVPANAAPQANGPTPGGGNVQPVASGPAQGMPTQPTAAVPVAPNPQGPVAAPKTPAERLSALRDGIAAAAEMPGLSERFEAARGDDGGLALRSGGREVGFLDARDAVQEKIAALLTQADADIAMSAGDAATLKSLTQARRELVGLAIAAEFPRLGAAVRAPFEARMPSSAAAALGDRFAKVKTLEAGALRIIARFDDPNQTGPVPFDGSILARLDAEIGALKSGGLTRKESETVGYLESLKAAVELRTNHDTAITNLGTLREGKVPIDKLCREITYLPGMFAMTGSPTLEDQRDAMEVLGKLAGQISRNVVPDMLTPRDPAIAKVVGDVRARHCQALAAVKFAAGVTDPQFAASFARLLDTARKTGGQVTRAEIAAILPGGQAAAFATRMDQAAKASATREQYFDQLGRLARIVGEDAAFAYKGSVWMKLGLPDTALTYKGKDIGSEVAKFAQELTADVNMVEVQRTGAALKRLAKENPQAAFLVAGLAVLEHQVATNDKEILGLPYYDSIAIADFDPGRIFAYAGVTERQMVKLGYDPALARDFPQRMHNLGKAGLRNPADVAALQGFLHKAALETFSNRAIQGAVGDFASGSGGAAAKRATVAMFSDAASLATGVRAPPGGDSRLSRASKPVVDGFTAMGAAMGAALAGDPRLSGNLAATGKLFAAADLDILDGMSARADLDGQVRDASAALTAATGSTGPLGGLDLDPNKPAGLRSAKAIDAALRFDDLATAMSANGAPPPDIALLRAARDAELDKLKGFDTETMRRPWHGKLASLFGRAERPDIATLRSVKAVAEGIIFVREGAPAARGAIDERIGATAQLRQNVAALRMAEDPAVMLTARQTIRAAVLANWPSDNVAAVAKEGMIVDAYEPAMHRAAIEATLTAWGFDLATFAPEISVACNGTLTVQDLTTWANEFRPVDRATGLVPQPVRLSLGTRLANAIRDGAGETVSKAGARDAILFLAANKKIMDAEFRQDILAIHQSLKDGDKFDFKTGYKLSLNSGKIPVDPSGSLGVRIKTSFAGLSNVVMERSGDGWKVTARFGVQGSLGGEFIADQRLDPNGHVSIGASVGAEGQATFLGGYTVTFPNDETGRAACAALIMNLADGERPSGELFESASDAATNREGGVKGGVAAKVYARAEFTATPFGEDGDVFGDSTGPTKKSAAANKIGVGGVASLEVGGTAAKKWKTTNSLNKVTKESERELTFGIAANLNVYGKVLTLPGLAIGALMDHAGAQDAADGRFTKDDKGEKGSYDVGSSSANESLFNLDLGLALQRTRKTKAEFTKSSRPEGGQPLAKAEIVQRSNCTLGTEAALVGIGNAALADYLGHDADFLRDYRAMKGAVGVNDALQVTYAMTPARLARFNELGRTADEHARTGNSVQAWSDRRAANAMLDDLDNFEPSKITVLKKVAQKDVANRGNALLVRVDITAEASWEESEVVLKIDAAKLKTAREAARAAA